MGGGWGAFRLAAAASELGLIPPQAGAGWREEPGWKGVTDLQALPWSARWGFSRPAAALSREGQKKEPSTSQPEISPGPPASDPLLHWLPPLVLPLHPNLFLHTGSGSGSPWAGCILVRTPCIP